MSSDRHTPVASWSRQEFSGLDLGDTRLDERLLSLADVLAAHPTSGINAACEDWAATKAAYRFFDNPKVSADQVLAPHFQRTVERMRDHQRVFAIQDTTYLDYTDHPSTQGLGPISTKSQGRQGLVKHTTLVVSASGLPLGCLTDQVWVRDASDKTDSKLKPLQERESYKWIEALSQTQTRIREDVEVIIVCDREVSDIYEFFIEVSKKTPFVIRAAQNRRIQDTYDTLKTLMNHSPLAGEFTLEVPARQQQPKRQADLQVYFAQTTLSPPYRSQVRGQTENLPTIDVYLVWVVEPHPPDGIPPIEWLLLTNVKVSTYSEARQRIHWYTHRWHVEVYFKVLKSGTKVEHTRLQTKDRLLRYIALMSVIAWRLYWMTLLNRDIPTADCTHALTENEWKALYMITHKTHTLPTQTPTVAQVVGWIAKLGGFLGRKSDGTPGVTVLWRGWQRLTDISNTFALFQETSKNLTP
ncbi:transposase [Candidatus Poribacteria bacterium]|nr:MAG: transposase [Candidatus Poribacteria bacterium]